MADDDFITGQLPHLRQERPDPVSADATATIAPGQLTDAGYLGEEDKSDSERAWDTAKAAGVEIGAPMATGIGATPLLAAGPWGWLAYAGIQVASGMGSNAYAQKLRDPEADWDLGEGVSSGVWSAVPGVGAGTIAKLGKWGTVGVRATEGAVMGAGEATTRQFIQIAQDKRENLDAFEIGFSGLAGTAIGGGLGRIEASSGFNRLGVSTTDAKKIQRRVEANVAKRVKTIDGLLKNEGIEGDLASSLRRERAELVDNLGVIKKGDKEYVDLLRKKQKQAIADADKQLVDMLENAQQQPKVGEGTVLRPEGDTPKASVEAPKTAAPKQPTKITKEQKLEILDRMGMSDDELASLIDPKTEILPLNLKAFTEETDVQKAMASVLEQIGGAVKSGRIKTDKKSLIKAAVDLRKKLDPSTDSLAYAQQIAKESEDIIYKAAVADSMTFHAFNNWSKRVNSGLDMNDPAVINDLLADIDRLGGFAEASSTIGSSAGKLLQSRKVFKEQIAAGVTNMERNAAKMEKTLTNDLIKYSDKLKPGEIKEQLEKLGGLKATRAFINELRLVRDPSKLGKLLEITRKSRFGRFRDAYMELRYDMILSSPQTQGAAALGNALMSMYLPLNQAIGGLVTGNLKATRHAGRTMKYLFGAIPDAYAAAKMAAKHSQGEMALSTHYEKVGQKALAMEATGLNNPLGETIENVGELVAFGPKGLVFQDELYRHMFAKAQVKALLAEEYSELVRTQAANPKGLKDFIEGRMSRYFVDGKRFRTKQDVEMEAIGKARESGLDADEAKDFVQKYTKDNWNDKTSSEIDYLRDFGDRVTFQQELSGDFGLFEAGGKKLQELREKSFVIQYIMPFIKTPVNIFKEAGGTLSLSADMPFVGGWWARSKAELQSDNPMIRAQARGRQVVGAGLWASAVYLATEKVLTGSGPRDYKQREIKKQTGWIPNAVNLSAAKRLASTGESGGDQPGDEYLSLSRADPLATVSNLAADVIRMGEDNDMPQDALSDVLVSISFGLSQAVASKSYLETVGNGLDAIVSGRFGEESMVEGVGEELIRGNTPAILNAIGRSEDPYLREVNGPLEQLANRLGPWSQSLDPKRDALGQKVPSGASRPKRELNTLLPTKLSRKTTDRAKLILEEVRGRYAFPEPTATFPGVDLRDLKNPETGQSAYDRWKQIYSETVIRGRNPGQAVVHAYEHPKVERLSEIPSGSVLDDLRYRTINSTLTAYREKALLQLVRDEYPELREQLRHNREQLKAYSRGEKVSDEPLAPVLQQLINNN